ncbi:MAG: helix-turn-helix domain-containing protein [Candidatus Polarisedimenticolia bacterium]
MKLKMRRSTGNVFRDIGFPNEEGEHLRVRSNLMLHLQKAISARNLTQSAAARLLHVTHPRISDLMRGRIDLFSTDTLIELLARLGIRVRIVVTSHRRKAGVA